MRFFTTAPAFALTLLLTAAATGLPARAFADQAIQTPQAPVVVIHSTSGLVTVTRGDVGFVRVTGNATATTFQMTSDNQGVMLPRGMGLPPRRLTLPGVREGTLGVRVENTGGDVTVYVPPRVAAVLVKADDGDAALSDFRGPYIVIANRGSVDLRSLFGFGHVRTTAGHVTMTGVGGNIHVDTTFGSVTGNGMLAERAEIRTQGGDIEWNFARLSGGPYRFTSGAGNVRVALNGNQAANIDAQSTQGTVVNRFARTAKVRFRSPHAMSLSLRGGGPEITAASSSGKVDVGPHRP
jgi:putative adhesin